MPIDWTRDEYVGRPGASPVVAALVAAGVLQKADRILDVGCGRGNDSLALASWGFRHIDAIDVNPRPLAAARRRARALELDGRVRWQRGSALELDAHYARASFDVVLDTLLFNNLEEEDAARYVRQVARVLRKDGVFAMQTKVHARSHQKAEDGAPQEALTKWFRPHAPLGTHLAEGTGSRKTHIPVVIRVARRNGRRA